LAAQIGTGILVKGEIVEKFDTALAEITGKIASLAEKHGPQTVELAGKVLQYKAIGGLVWPFVAIAGLVFCVKTFVYRLRTMASSDDPDGLIIGRLFLFGAGAFFLGFATMIGVFDFLLNPLVWAAAFDPSIAIAAKVLGALK
jgi:hypothetical protein